MHGLPITISYGIVVEYPGFIASDDVFHQFTLFILLHKKT